MDDPDGRHFLRRFWPRRTLMRRVTLTYTVGALLLSSTVAVTSFELTRQRMLNDAQAQHQSQSYTNAGDVRQQLAQFPSPPADLDDEVAVTEYQAAVNDAYNALLSGLRNFNDSESMIILDDGDIKTLSSDLSNQSIPSNLQILLSDGARVADARFSLLGRPSYVVGVRLHDFDLVYYEVLSLQATEGTLRQLRWILIIVAIGAGLAGALLGYSSARRALAPLRKIVSAASNIAAGNLDERLDLQADRDLSVLSSAFNEMVEKLNNRIERERRFASDVSHELRSPLTTLAASMEVLEKRRAGLPVTAQKALDLLSAEVTRFNDLVEDLLEISRLEADVVQLAEQMFRLDEFLEFVVSQSRRPDIEIRYPSTERELVVWADKRRLAQVMTNLIDNAEKYASGVDHIAYERRDDSAQIAVADLGPGVAPTDRERIFERFGRVRAEAGNRSDGTGTGLGLALVAQHVKAHGGNVWVTDRLDGRKGARFVVDIPLRREQQDYMFDAIEAKSGIAR